MPGMTRSGEQPGLKFLFRWASCHQAGLHWKRRKLLQVRKTRCSSLQNPTRRPPRPREPIPVHLLEHVSPDQFELDEEKFLQNLRSAHRGVAGGPSGMTSEHLRILLENVRDGHLFFLMGQQLAQAVAHEAGTQAMRFGRLTASQKPNGGIRGIVASDVVRRLVSRTITQQLSDAALAATSPFQYALSTRAGCECISHALQSLSELDPMPQFCSFGIGAFDLVSRGAMLQGLANLCQSALPFRSPVLWQSIALHLGGRCRCVVHNISQGEGGEQGDPMMAVVVLFGATCGTHGGPASRLEADERVFAFLDDAVYTILQAELWRHSRIRVHDGPVCVQKGATFWTVQVGQSIQNSTPFGAVMDPRTHKASKHWVRLWATKICAQRRTTCHYWRKSLCCQRCSQHGLCCCIAPAHGPITCCVQSVLS